MDSLSSPTNVTVHSSSTATPPESPCHSVAAVPLPPSGDESDRASMGSMPSMQTVSESEDESSAANTRWNGTLATGTIFAPVSPPTTPPTQPTDGATGSTAHQTPAQPNVTRVPPTDPRRYRNSRRDGGESDGSLPSLQTVSDSSEDDAFGSDSEDSDEGDYDEDGSSGLLPSSDNDRRRGRGRARSEDEEDEEDGWEDEEEPPTPDFSWTAADLFLTSGGDGSGSGRAREQTLASVRNLAEMLGLLAQDAPHIVQTVNSLFPEATAQATSVMNTLQGVRAMFEEFRGTVQPQNDPTRADIIMKDLEEVPPPLISRYENLRKGNDGEDCEGCAICRDVFLAAEEEPAPEPSEIEAFMAELPFNMLQPDKRILAFPCPGMHLFHAQCISPWLARKTTCPTCRYDVDPDSLTLRGRRDAATGVRLSKVWSPPKGRGFQQWLEKEEKRKDGRTSTPDVAPTPTATSTNARVSDVESEDEYADDEDEDDDELPPRRSLDPDIAEDILGHVRARANLAGSPSPPRRTRLSTARGAVSPDNLGGFSEAMRQSMLAALSPLHMPAMGNEYEDEFENAVASGSPLNVPLVPPIPVDEEDESDLPPLAEESEDEDSTPPSADESEDDDDLPPLADASDHEGPPFALMLDMVVDVRDPIDEASPAASQPIVPPPPRISASGSAWTQAARTGRLLSPLDIMRPSPASSPSLPTSSPSLPSSAPTLVVSEPTTSPATSVTTSPTGRSAGIARFFRGLTRTPWRSRQMSPQSEMADID